jgi:stage II sporulation protein D
MIAPRGPVLFGVICFFLFCFNGLSLSREVTTADRLAILYTPQFNFTRDGEPLIHVGVFQGAQEVEFGSTHPMRVLPLGEGGPELTLPARKRFQIQITSGRPGRYRHWVVVEKLPYAQQAAIDEATERWVRRGYLPEPLEVGGLFAVGGRRFDSRAVLLGVGGMADLGDAQALSERLDARYGLETALHAELKEYPGGTLRISGGGLPGEFVHQDVFWVGPSAPGQEFTVRAGAQEFRYAGSLVFTADREGRLQVINAVPAETLVKGVVPSEVYTSAPMESLKAQAVAARGEVLSYLGARHLADPFKLCSEVHCQSYKGLSREDPRTNAAVEATRGEVMFEADSLGGEWRIVDARYSSSSGGHTENNEDVWGDQPHPYLRGRPDAIELPAAFQGGIHEGNIEAWLRSDHPAWSNTERFGGKNTWRWDRAVEIQTVQEWFDRHQPIGRLKDFEILARGVSGRVIKMKFIGERGEATLDRELAVRRAFGGLRSSMFVMKVERDARGLPTTLRFRGGGFGHGVGMCQTGAMIMGEKGRKYNEILTYYYRGVALRRLY